MSDHFSAIGLAFDSPEDFQDCLLQLLDEAVEEHRDDAHAHVRWTDASGASIAAHLDADGRIACVTPFFAPPQGLTRLQVSTSAGRDDDECLHCGGADCDILVDGDMVTRTALQWLHYQPYQRWLGTARAYDVEVAAFAHSIALFGSAEEFAASDASLLGTEANVVNGKPMRFAAESFIPAGMFSEGNHIGTRATALIVGRIEAASRLRNTATESPFWHLRVQTVPGALDVVVAADAILAPPPLGGVAICEAWLVGRPTVAPPAA